jgi:plastocyanin
MRAGAKLTFQVLGFAALLGPAGANDGAIVQKNERFAPTTVTIKKGQAIVVKNEDPFVHHVFVEDTGMKYDSGEQRPGRVLTIKFDTPGEYVLECAIHLKMKLKVIVKDE